MAGKNTSVLALFANEAETENAVSRLREAGFRNTDVSILMQRNLGNKDFGHEKQSKSPEGVATGGTAGAIIGGLLGGKEGAAKGAAVGGGAGTGVVLATKGKEMRLAPGADVTTTLTAPLTVRVKI